MSRSDAGRLAADWWARTITVVVMVIAIGFTVVYVSISEQKWCEVLATLDNPVPPAADNPRAVVAARQIKELRSRFGC